jgi:hypothetical protein
MVTLRIRKSSLKQFDKTCPKGQRAEKLRELMEAEAVKNGNQSGAAVNYGKLKADADDCRREMARLRKVMGQAFEAVKDVALSFAPLTPENIPLIIKELYQYTIQPEDHFSRASLEDFLEYLETMKKHNDLLSQIDAYRKDKFGTEPEHPELEAQGGSEEKKREKQYRHIRRSERCSCGRNETFYEHNRRAFYLTDVKMWIGIDPTNRFTGTPEGQLRGIREAGEEHCTSAEEKSMIVQYLKKHGTVNQKAMVNSYFFFRLFPVPFPECETYYKGKLVTENLTCQEIRSILLTRKELERAEEQSKLNRLNPRRAPWSNTQMITNSKWGWMYTEEGLKAWMGDRLKEHSEEGGKTNSEETGLNEEEDESDGSGDAELEDEAGDSEEAELGEDKSGDNEEIEPDEVDDSGEL